MLYEPVKNHRAEQNTGNISVSQEREIFTILLRKPEVTNSKKGILIPTLIELS